MKKTQKILAGTLVAGIVMFFLGWLIYGVLLAGFLSANCDNSNARPMEEMVWWALILANFASGLLLALTLGWSGSITMGAGFKIGALLGLLIALAFDLSMYAMTTMYSNLAVIVVDSLGYAILYGLSGLLIAPIMNKVGN